MFRFSTIRVLAKTNILVASLLFRGRGESEWGFI